MAKFNSFVLILGGPTGRSPDSLTGQSAPGYMQLIVPNRALDKLYMACKRMLVELCFGCVQHNNASRINLVLSSRA